MTEIIANLTTNPLTGRLCHVCGCTEEVPVAAEATDENGAVILRVCASCLKDGDLDARLATRAAEHEAEAARVRALIGRVKIPCYSDYEAMTERLKVADFAAWTIEKATDDVYRRSFLERQRVLADDHVAAQWRAKKAEHDAAQQARVRASAVPAWVDPEVQF
jgi:hypothetical protein